jgi:hypothetical protein
VENIFLITNQSNACRVDNNPMGWRRATKDVDCTQFVLRLFSNTSKRHNLLKTFNYETRQTLFACFTSSRVWVRIQFIHKPLKFRETVLKSDCVDRIDTLYNEMYENGFRTTF